MSGWIDKSKYDAIVAGGSFAGLAVASRIEERALLIDRDEVGSGQTSACGTFLSTAREFGCENSVLQTFRRVVFHIPEEYEVRLIEPLCTFDYKRFCDSLMDNVGADILKAKILGMREGAVVTDAGKFRARCTVDCTGWRALLAGSLKRNFVRKDRLGFWLETDAKYEDDMLHIYAIPHIIPDGLAWIFPIGEFSRIGVGSYCGNRNLLKALKLFFDDLGLVFSGKCHGNAIPYGLREPTVDDIFVVGDAGGQALPLTAEGIRKSLRYGSECGRIINAVIGEEISLVQGLEEYRGMVVKSMRGYEALLAVQRISVETGVPDILMRAFMDRKVSEKLQKAYLSI